MSNVNIAAIASGAFIGFLALLCIVACVPPVTRFLGDLFCCPWRIPFTKKKRRNGDEDLEKSDFPYLTGHDESERIGTPGNHEEYHRMSAAYMSAVSLVDPATAKEEVRRSAEYRRSGEYRLGTPPHNERRQSWGPYSAGYHSSGDMGVYQHYDDGYAASQHQHLQVPAQQYGNWRQPSPDRHLMPGAPGHQQPHHPPPHPSANSSPERHNNYPPQQQPHPHDYYHHGEEAYSPEHYPGDHYAEAYVDVQRPPPSHVHTPPDVNHHSYSHGYFPQDEWEQEDYHPGNYNNNRPQASNERLMGPRQQQYYNA